MVPYVCSGICRHSPASLLSRGSLRSLLRPCCGSSAASASADSSRELLLIKSLPWKTNPGGQVGMWNHGSVSVATSTFLWFQKWMNTYGFSYFFSLNKSNQCFDITDLNKNTPRDCLTKSGLSATKVSCFMLLLLFHSFCKQWLWIFFRNVTQQFNYIMMLTPFITS